MSEGEDQCANNHPRDNAILAARPSIEKPPIEDLFIDWRDNGSRKKGDQHIKSRQTADQAFSLAVLRSHAKPYFDQVRDYNGPDKDKHIPQQDPTPIRRAKFLPTNCFPRNSLRSESDKIDAGGKKDRHHQTG